MPAFRHTWMKYIITFFVMKGFVFTALTWSSSDFEALSLPFPSSSKLPEPQNHRTVWVETDLNHLVATPCHGQGCHTTGQVELAGEAEIKCSLKTLLPVLKLLSEDGFNISHI